MKEYLKMEDYFDTGYILVDGSSLHDASGVVAKVFGPSAYASYVAHAINSHDELVAMNKELLDVIERVIGSSREFDKIMGTSEWADGYKQCAIDTGEALRVILDSIKAKGTA